MKPALDDINACRAVVQWLLRGLGALCVATGVVICLSRILLGLATGDWYTGLRNWGDPASFFNGLALLVVGAALALSARRLSRWIVVLPPSGCPRCGHLRAPGGQDARCPECGLEWPRR